MANLLVKLKLGLVKTWNFRGNAFLGNSGRGSLIEGRFFYTMENKPISAGRTKTGAYVGENRKFDDRFRVKGYQEFVETNASSPTVQLQIVRLFLAVIRYRKSDFRAVDVSWEFPRSVPLKRDAYVGLPDGVDKGNSESTKTTVWADRRL